MVAYRTRCHPLVKIKMMTCNVPYKLFAVSILNLFMHDVTGTFLRHSCRCSSAFNLPYVKHSHRIKLFHIFINFQLYMKQTYLYTLNLFLLTLAVHDSPFHFVYSQKKACAYAEFTVRMHNF